MMSTALHARSSRKVRRKCNLIGSFVAVFIILIIYYNHGWLARSSTANTENESVDPAHHLLAEQARFWRSIYHIILNNDPHCNKPPDIVIPEKLDIAFENDHVHNRPDILWIETPDLERLRVAHQNFLTDIQASDIKLVYEKGTRGIITTVGDAQIPIVLIQLRMLRATGSQLPVEVFLSEPNPYTEHICKNIFSLLNATCVYLKEVFRAAGTGVGLQNYQYKIFAILFSTFDEVLLLDSDAWPVSNPDHLFTYPPFTDTGMVVWPDFWYASESPYYFTIAKIAVPPDLHSKPATESGELMYAKSRHEKSIMLAAYYNYHGPEYYYPLQSQGAPGQGDKETFPCAALALNDAFYSVKTMVNAIGRTDSSGHFFGSAMVQYDPIVDFQHRHSPPDPSKLNSKPMFVHANTPKFDPRTIFGAFDMGNGFVASPTRDTNGTMVRCWTKSVDEAVTRFGYDIERRFWEVSKRVACEDLGGDGGETVRGKKNAEFETCRKVVEYLKKVFE